MEVLKMSTAMNKVFWGFFCLLSIAVIVLSVNVLSFERDLPVKPFSIHLKILSKTAEHMKVSCYKHQEKVRRTMGGNNEALRLQTIASIDTIMSFADSADYFFKRLTSLKGDAKEAKKCFDQYGQFSERFTAAIRLAMGHDRRAQNYLLGIERWLPAGELSFDSGQEVQLLALLLEIEFYERTQDTLTDLASFCENW
jgi:hypothetical protein